MSDCDRILLLTGRMAYDDVCSVAEEFPNVCVEVLPISVAAFTTTRMILRQGPELVAKHSPDLIIVSGMAQGDFSTIGEKLGTRVLKGTRNVSSLALLLREIEKVAHRLSPFEPADKIIQESLTEHLRKQIHEIEHEASFETRNFRIRSGLPIGLDFPPRVMAEIVDVTTHPIEVSLSKAQRLAEHADILDLGTNIESPDPDRMAEVVTEVRKLGLPVSIDTLNPKEIEAGVDAGAEIVLSIDRGNQDVVSRIPEDVALVCLPTNVSQGVFPRSPLERANNCHELCCELASQGHSRLLADPLLEATIQPGLMTSLNAYHLCRQLDGNRPFLAGFGNVTEFIDADTSGVNSLLACLGIELGISVFLTTEERAAAIYSTRELKSASMMGFAAKIAGAPPRELGFSSFLIKSGDFDTQTIQTGQSFDMVSEELREYEFDPKGCFRIAVDHTTGRILCEQTGPDGVIARMEAQNAISLLQVILSRDLVSHLDHAVYLGCELTKAEISLKFGRNYVQDASWKVQ
ncbi:MAG: dihydropteroate synthase-like protein [Candidatus Thorarchaeota archaeon]